MLDSLILTEGVTNANFYYMVDYVIFGSIYFLQDEFGMTIGRDSRSVLGRTILSPMATIGLLHDYTTRPALSVSI